MGRTRNDIIRFAVIGCGLYAQDHLRGYRTLHQHKVKGIQIAAVCDLDHERAEKYAKAVGEFQNTPAVYDDIEEMLKNETLDAADVVTSHPGHHTVAISCLEAGLHVTVEKPFAITLKAGRKMLQIAKENKRILASAEPVRRSIPNRAMHWAINQKGMIGKLRMVFAQETRYSLQVVVGTPWRHKKLQGGGGWILDGEVHYMDLLRYLFGDVKRVYAETRNYERLKYVDAKNRVGPVDSEVEDTCMAIFTFKNGVPATFTWTHGAPGQEFSHRSYYGSEGSINNQELVLKNGKRIPFRNIQKEFMNSLSDEERERLFPHGITDINALAIYDLYNAIVNGTKPEVTGMDGYKAQAICEAIYESAYIGQAVFVEDIESGRIDNFQLEIDNYYNL